MKFKYYRKGMHVGVKVKNIKKALELVLEALDYIDNDKVIYFDDGFGQEATIGDKDALVFKLDKKHTLILSESTKKNIAEIQIH